jgi:opacity protein-like surface antigen
MKNILKGLISVVTALAMLIIFTCRGEAAFLGDTLKPFVNLSEMYDSNVFRVKDSGQLQALVGDKQLYDFITTVSMGTKLHYSISQAELNLLIKDDYSIYEHYSNQNRNQFDVNGDLALAFFDKVKMRIFGEYKTGPEDRVDYRSAAVNDSTFSTYGASLGYETPTGIGFEAGYRRMGIDYSLAQFSANLFTEDSYTGTVSYRLSAESKIYAAYQHDDTKYDADSLVNGTLVNNSNAADSFRIGLEKTVSPKTAISCYIGYLDRQHDHASARDYSGVIGKLAATYALTGKLGLQLSGERQIYEETYQDEIYIITSSFRIGLAYDITDKIKAAVFNNLKWKDFRGIPVTNVPERSDFQHAINFGLEWSPLHRLAVNLGYQYSMRSSNVETFKFTDHIVMASVGYKF